MLGTDTAKLLALLLMIEIIDWVAIKLTNIYTYSNSVC